ncbi:hypothetical protein A2690_02865 [Candidatus Roizmanbacteria bacterium RIFCSPHIGHO2_01_FULL_39_12b]|uniref:AAA family ATPase n=1 Tax=Candidatus Roizmanbacteria bacterium RIFCSPHIGHO2_01_FULL_39_12b TaxID=1802030 RepID=A0A1F7G7Y0_9BACT|nr:MAG: hypothetical protein A2690_02865 [Candidatus Roizmanbacteria bacterium RIFCSPHIGHO2_01_FULL_39_12b]OGK45923.1 MAG: hypothetical protein A3B46_02680 [Candidatus Roizmanbacteria bacterium RIFCSPLOWO2_01_FULL_39_19]
MIKRLLEKQVKHATTQFPVVSITGPRQSGKTTLIKKCFPTYEYYNLEDPNTRSFIKDDPKQVVNITKKGAIFDEVQKYPDLLSFIQVTVDETNKPGQYIISGSENLLLSEKVSQSLAGRVAVLNLLTLSISELQADKLLDQDVFAQIYKGFYPRIYDQNISATDFYSNYVNTYIERDVRLIKNIGDISQFQRFIQLLAGRAGQLSNASAIANDLNVDSKTISSWLNILEATYIIFRLQPYFRNFGKRIIKNAKIYFHDVGLLAYLLGINSTTDMDVHFARGALFENLVVAEIMKHIVNFNTHIKPYFWRDSTGNEIDILVDKGNMIDRFEIKASQTYKSDFSKGFDYWDGLPKQNKQDGNNYVIYNGNIESKVKNYRLINWKNIDHAFA